jgi:hypothetical protein
MNGKTDGVGDGEKRRLDSANVDVMVISKTNTS